MESNGNTKISLIVPVYQAEEYLARCFDSILNQTYKDFEVIVIDDGSEDRSPEICDAYARRDSRFHVFHQKNGGVSVARKAGFEKSSGDILYWIDADDYISPDLLEKTYFLFEEENADIVVYDIADDNNGKIRKVHFTESDLRGWQRRAVQADCSVLWMFASRRSLWKGLKIPVELTHSGEDGYLSLHLFYRARNIVHGCGGMYYNDVANEASLTHRVTSRKFWGSFWMWKERAMIAKCRFPEIFSYCCLNASKAAIKSYCISVVLRDLEDKRKQGLFRWLSHMENHPASISPRDKILRYAIVHRKEWICRLYARHKLK